MLIVTNRCYITAEKVHHIAMMESHDWDHETTPPKRYTSYQISVYYTLEKNVAAGREDNRLEFNINDEKEANRVYQEMLHQVREQCPDPAHMDKLIDTYVLGEGDEAT
jgi:hypothetical protein